MSGWMLLYEAGREVRCKTVRVGMVIGSRSNADMRLVRTAGRHARVRAGTTDRGEAELRLVPIDGQVRVDGVDASAQGVPLVSGVAMQLGGTVVVPVRGAIRRSRRWLTACGLTSASPLVWRAMHALAVSGVQDWPLLLLGESGVGKEVAARFGHAASLRRDGPFVTVNCAALPAGLLESELFGSRRGAFTGAVEDRDGAFVRAHGGTLFLDEIGELSAAGQAALLRVLEAGEVQVVGGVTRRIDVRVVAATNVDLDSAAWAGRFRFDLLQRLAVTRVTLPPVRYRHDDGLLLLEEMLGCRLPRRAADVVRAYSWPGNVREVRNVVRRIRLNQPTGEPQPTVVRRALHPARTTMVTAPVRRPSQRMRLVAESLAASGSMVTAMRNTGLPRSTFFRYAARVRRASDAPGRGSSGVLDGAPRGSSVKSASLLGEHP